MKFKVLFVKTLQRNSKVLRVYGIFRNLEKKLQEIWNTQYYNGVGSINLLTLRVLFRSFAIYDFNAFQSKNIVGACRTFDKFSSISFNELIIYIYRLDEWPEISVDLRR